MWALRGYQETPFSWQTIENALRASRSNAQCTAILMNWLEVPGREEMLKAVAKLRLPNVLEVASTKLAITQAVRSRRLTNPGGPESIKLISKQVYGGGISGIY